MKAASWIVSCLFLLGGSAGAFAIEDVPEFLFGASGDEESASGNETTDGNQTAGNETAAGNSTADGNGTAEGNATAESGNQTAGNATADGNGTAGGNATADGNGTAEGNATAESGNQTTEGNATAEAQDPGGGDETSEGPEREEDIRIYDEGTAVGEIDREWSWQVSGDEVEDLWVRLEFRASGVVYAADDLEMTLRDGAGRVLASVEDPGTTFGEDPILEYRVSGPLTASPGTWTMELGADVAFAEYEFDVLVHY